MAFVSIVAAAVAAFGFGAIWYSLMARQWMAASGVKVGEDGKPANASNPLPYIIGFISALLVAATMQHAFTRIGFDRPILGLMAGFGVGLFMATPWLATCYSFAGRPLRLILIDGVYATVGCSLIGVVLTLFS